MRELFVTRETVHDMMYNSIVMAATLMPSDVKDTLLEYVEKEQYETAKLHLETIIGNCELAEKEGRLICPDTGSPLFYVPKVEVRFDPRIDFLDVIAIPKGGGSEIFGTFYRMMFPADGKKGIMKFILDCIKESTYAGKTCPPNVIGIGIGGTADICMKIPKEAAVLPPFGQ